MKRHLIIAARVLILWAIWALSFMSLAVLFGTRPDFALALFLLGGAWGMLLLPLLIDIETATRKGRL